MERRFDAIMSGDAGKIIFEGATRTREEILGILVERASMTEEERRKLEEQERRKIERTLQEMRNTVEDRLALLSGNPNIPKSIIEMLKNGNRE